MTVAVPDLEARRPLLGGLPLALSLALREQRNGLRGFYVFIACVALGVAVITGVGALADALRSSFERQGEALLGGDVTLSRPHRPATTSSALDSRFSRMGSCSWGVVTSPTMWGPTTRASTIPRRTHGRGSRT